MVSEDVLVPTGIYWDPQTWDLARAAYVADLDSDRRCPDAFVGWLHLILEDHAGRTPQERAQLDISTPARRREGQGRNRTYPLRSSTLDLVESAIVADRRECGRVVSRSGFVHEAAVMAIAAARARLGRELPDPPARLPNRPVRRPSRV